MTRFAAFRALAPDAGAGGGTSVPDEGTPDYDDLAEAAYESLGHSADPDDIDADDEEGESDEEDLDWSDSALSEESLDLDPDFVLEQPEMAEVYRARVATLRENEAAIAPMLGLEAALADPYEAPETLRRFAEALAEHHGFDLTDIFGLRRPDLAVVAADAPLDWRSLGFDSPEAYAAAPEYAQQGYDSPGEARLAQELAQLRATVEPFLRHQERMTATAQAQAARGRFEEAVLSAAPSALAALRAEHGFGVTEAHALEAAFRFPQIAAEDLGAAILAAFPLDFARHYAEMASGRRPLRPDMPESGGRRGYVAPDAVSASFDELADHVYATL